MIELAAEKNFENKIKQFLGNHNCWHVKFFANAYTKAGVPDILACVNGYFVAIEVKAPNGSPSELQKFNVKQINKNDGFAVIVKPEQYDDLTYMLHCLRHRDEYQAREICDKINTLWGI